MNRRNFLTAAPALAFATPALANAAPVQAEGETPVMQLFRQWAAMLPEVQAAAKADAPGWDAMLERQTDLEDAMLRAPAVDARDFAAKVLAYCHEGAATLPNLPELWAEGRRVLGVTL